MSDKKAGAAHCKRVYTLFPIQIPKKFLQNRPQLVIHPTFVIPDGPYGRLRQAQIERLRHKTDQIPGPYVPEYLHQPQRLKIPDQKFRLRHRDAVLIRFLFYPENQTMQVIPEFLEEILRHGAHPLLLPLGLLRKEECINDHFVQRIGRVPYLFSDFLVRAAQSLFPAFFLTCSYAYLFIACNAGFRLYPLPIDGKYPLPHPEVRSFVSQVPWSYTSKSLVSYTEVPCFKAHPKTARLSSPAGVSTSSSLSANRSPAAPSLTPGLPPPIWTTVSRPIPASNPPVKDRQFLPPVTSDFEFVYDHNSHRFIVL